MGDTFLKNLTLTTCLGSGAFGFVFAAQTSDTPSHQQFAVKFVPKDNNFTKEDHFGLERETMISLLLPEHLNVVKTFDFVEKSFTPSELKELLRVNLIHTEHQHDMRDTLIAISKRVGTVTLMCIQMEMCGPTLRHWLQDDKVRQKNPIDLSYEQFRIVLDVLEGLKFLHKRKIVHRDIKPENLMFSLPSSEYTFPLKVGDFALCRVCHTVNSKTATLTSTVGSWDYMAPEVTTGQYGQQCDIYSFGLITWEVLQLISGKSRKKMFDCLIYDMNYELIQDHTTFPGIKESIISMTMRNPSGRMKSLDQLKLAYIGEGTGEEFSKTQTDTKQNKDVERKLQQLTMQETFLSNLSLQGCLGSGSYGIVFGAQNGDTSEQFAVKFIRNDSSLDKNGQLELERECKLSLQLPEHKNIVRVFDVAETTFQAKQLKALWDPKLLQNEDQHTMRDQIIAAAKRKDGMPLVALQMEMCGETLRNWLLDEPYRKQMEVGQLQFFQFQILRDLAEGLRFLHSNNIMHRDVKPDNVMFSFSQSTSEYPFPLKVGDFGLCRRFHSESTKTSTLSRKAGADDYRAPEVAIGTYGRQCDVYSFGLVVWEVVQLFPWDSRKHMFDSLKIDKDYNLIQDHEVFLGIKESIISMTMRKPEERMQSLEEFELSFNDPTSSPPVENPLLKPC